MGQRVSTTDFEWSTQEEPHASRRKEILRKYPEIKQLFGFDKTVKWKILVLCFIQLCMLPLVSDMNWPLLFLTIYCISAVINNAILIAIHEVAHSLCYGHSRPMANRILGFIANLPIGLPLSASFKRYHLEHHRYQGDAVYDPDIPSTFEAKLFYTTFGKLIWVILLPFFYLLRPLIRNPKPLTIWELVNIILQLGFNYIVYNYFGVKAIVYLIGGTILGSGFHPVAARLISEHYMVRKGFETYSYYGPLNYITFNVGYHNEHHDFPAVPSCNLPKVREIAREYYDVLPYHTSWVKVMYDFITDPNIGLYARNKRKCVKMAQKQIQMQHGNNSEE